MIFGLHMITSQIPNLPIKQNISRDNMGSGPSSNVRSITPPPQRRMKKQLVSLSSSSSLYSSLSTSPSCERQKGHNNSDINGKKKHRRSNHNITADEVRLWLYNHPDFERALLELDSCSSEDISQNQFFEFSLENDDEEYNKRKNGKDGEETGDLSKSPSKDLNGILSRRGSGFHVVAVDTKAAKVIRRGSGFGVGEAAVQSALTRRRSGLQILGKSTLTPSPLKNVSNAKENGKSPALMMLQHQQSQLLRRGDSFTSTVEVLMQSKLANKHLDVELDSEEALQEVAAIRVDPGLFAFLNPELGDYLHVCHTWVRKRVIAEGETEFRFNELLQKLALALQTSILRDFEYRGRITADQKMKPLEDHHISLQLKLRALNEQYKESSHKRMEYVKSITSNYSANGGNDSIGVLRLSRDFEDRHGGSEAFAAMMAKHQSKAELVETEKKRHTDDAAIVEEQAAQTAHITASNCLLREAGLKLLTQVATTNTTNKALAKVPIFHTVYQARSVGTIVRCTLNAMKMTKIEMIDARLVQEKAFDRINKLRTSQTEDCQVIIMNSYVSMLNTLAAISTKVREVLGNTVLTLKAAERELRKQSNELLVVERQSMNERLRLSRDEVLVELSDTQKERRDMKINDEATDDIKFIIDKSDENTVDPPKPKSIIVALTHCIKLKDTVNHTEHYLSEIVRLYKWDFTTDKSDIIGADLSRELEEVWLTSFEEAERQLVINSINDFERYEDHLLASMVTSKFEMALEEEAMLLLDRMITLAKISSEQSTRIFEKYDSLKRKLDGIMTAESDRQNTLLESRYISHAQSSLALHNIVTFEQEKAEAILDIQLSAISQANFKSGKADEVVETERMIVRHQNDISTATMELSREASLSILKLRQESSERLAKKLSELKDRQKNVYDNDYGFSSLNVAGNDLKHDTDSRLLSVRERMETEALLVQMDSVEEVEVHALLRSLAVQITEMVARKGEHLLSTLSERKLLSEEETFSLLRMQNKLLGSFDDALELRCASVSNMNCSNTYRLRLDELASQSHMYREREKALISQQLSLVNIASTNISLLDHRKLLQRYRKEFCDLSTQFNAAADRSLRETTLHLARLSLACKFKRVREECEVGLSNAKKDFEPKELLISLRRKLEGRISACSCSITEQRNRLELDLDEMHREKIVIRRDYANRREAVVKTLGVNLVTELFSKGLIKGEEIYSTFESSHVHREELEQLLWTEQELMEAHLAIRKASHKLSAGSDALLIREQHIRESILYRQPQILLEELASKGKLTWLVMESLLLSHREQISKLRLRLTAEQDRMLSTLDGRISSEIAKQDYMLKREHCKKLQQVKSGEKDMVDTIHAQHEIRFEANIEYENMIQQSEMEQVQGIARIRESLFRQALHGLSALRQKVVHTLVERGIMTKEGVTSWNNMCKSQEIRINECLRLSRTKCIALIRSIHSQEHSWNYEASLIQQQREREKSWSFLLNDIVSRLATAGRITPLDMEQLLIKNQIDLTRTTVNIEVKLNRNLGTAEKKYKQRVLTRNIDMILNIEANNLKEVEYNIDKSVQMQMMERDLLEKDLKAVSLEWCAEKRTIELVTAKSREGALRDGCLALLVKLQSLPTLNDPESSRIISNYLKEHSKLVEIIEQENIKQLKLIRQRLAYRAEIDKVKENADKVLADRGKEICNRQSRIINQLAVDGQVNEEIRKKLSNLQEQESSKLLATLKVKKIRQEQAVMEHLARVKDARMGKLRKEHFSIKEKLQSDMIVASTTLMENSESKDNRKEPNAEWLFEFICKHWRDIHKLNKEMEQIELHDLNNLNISLLTQMSDVLSGVEVAVGTELSTLLWQHARRVVEKESNRLKQNVFQRESQELLKALIISTTTVIEIDPETGAELNVLECMMASGQLSEAAAKTLESEHRKRLESIQQMLLKEKSKEEKKIITQVTKAAKRRQTLLRTKHEKETAAVQDVEQKQMAGGIVPDAADVLATQRIKWKQHEEGEQVKKKMESDAIEAFSKLRVYLVEKKDHLLGDEHDKIMAEIKDTGRSILVLGEQIIKAHERQVNDFRQAQMNSKLKQTERFRQRLSQRKQLHGS